MAAASGTASTTRATRTATRATRSTRSLMSSSSGPAGAPPHVGRGFCRRITLVGQGVNHALTSVTDMAFRPDSLPQAGWKKAQVGKAEKADHRSGALYLDPLTGWARERRQQAQRHAGRSVCPAEREEDVGFDGAVNDGHPVFWCLRVVSPPRVPSRKSPCLLPFLRSSVHAEAPSCGRSRCVDLRQLRCPVRRDRTWTGPPAQVSGRAGRGWVSYMRTATIRPEAAVRAATAQIAVVMP